MMTMFAVSLVGFVSFAAGQALEQRKIGRSGGSPQPRQNRLVEFLLAVWNELFDMLKQVPHLILIVQASVFFLGEFGKTVLPVWIAYSLAIGVEWSYLRGIVVTRRSLWSVALTFSAFGTSMLWGVLFVSIETEAMTLGEPATAWWVAVAHVVPISWISLCSAMVHREVVQAEAAERAREAVEQRERERRLQEERDRIELERIKQQAQLELWEQGQRVKNALDLERKQARLSVSTKRVSEASGTQMNTFVNTVRKRVPEHIREQIREQIQREQNGAPRKARKAWADELGISRTQLYKELAELAPNQPEYEQEVAA